MRGRHAVLLCAGVLALDVALFIPGFVFSQRPAALLPFFPTEHPHGAYGFDARSAVEYVKSLTLRRANLDPFRVSAEYVGLLALLVLSAATRARRGVLAGAVGLYAATAVFLTYHAALRFYFSRPPAVTQDVRLLKNLGHLLAEMGPAFAVGAIAGGLVVLTAVVMVPALVFGGVQRWATEVPFTRRAGLSAFAV
ncbi:MAG: hypothetical protein JNG84_01330, partial [Archangium sp.]|nr:hypothetical protein [Archangium sp.]